MSKPTYKHSFAVGKEASDNLAESLRVISMAVGSTLGPGGRPFGYDKLDPSQRLISSFSKDGLTVLKALHSDKPEFQAVLNYCRQAAIHSVLASGDGPQPMHSKVLTPAGFVEMRDVKVGMRVCGTNGTIQTVLGVYPKGEKEVYEVEFANRGVVECCADHLWFVIDNIKWTNPESKVKTTQELGLDYRRDIIHKKHNKTYNGYRYYTPKTHVEFDENPENMPLDPYLLGILLGDGSLSGTGSVELSLGFNKKHILDKIVVPDGIWLNTTKVDHKNYYRVKLNGKTSDGRSMFDILGSLNLLGTKSDTKFIPKSYLYSSTKSRTALLQGILDTDGYVGERGLFSISSVGEQLINDIKELCFGLGKSLYYELRERSETDGSYSMTPIHRISELKGYQYGNKLIRITPTGRFAEMQCIKVSNPDSLYITDNYVVTHNTSSTTTLANAVCQAILTSGHKYPQAYARLIEKQASQVIEALKKEAIKTDEVVRQVALTSTNGDEELTDVTLEAIRHSSAFGSILVNKIPDAKKRYNIKKQDGYGQVGGYYYNETFALSADQATASSKPIEWDSPRVLIFNGSLMQKAQIEPIISKWAQYFANNGNEKLVILAFDLSDEVANTLITFNRINAKHGNCVFIVRPQLTAEQNGQLQIMRDVAAFTGVQDSHIVDGGNFKSLDQSYFGVCGKVKVGHQSTVFLGRAPNHFVETRVLQNADLAAAAKSEFNREMVKIRSAELAEGLVTVEIGDGHMPDLQERADRFDDASKAAKACLQSGALPGCGSSYIRGSNLVEGIDPGLKTALRSIYETVLLNYGVDPDPNYNPEAGVSTCISEDGISVGNAFENNVVDSCETVCSVIKNGVSLGVKIATLGGYLFRNQDFDDVHIMSL